MNHPFPLGTHVTVDPVRRVIDGHTIANTKGIVAHGTVRVLGKWKYSIRVGKKDGGGMIYPSEELVHAEPQP